MVAILTTAGSLAETGKPPPAFPAANPDGSIDIYFGHDATQGQGKNWLRTAPGKGFFVILRLYGPTQPFFRSDMVAERSRQGAVNPTRPNWWFTLPISMLLLVLLGTMSTGAADCNDKSYLPCNPIGL